MPKDDATLSAASVGSAMRYASVCDGIGAAHVAWQPLGWQCQWTSEIEPFPAAVVEHHYGFRNLGDMTAITEEMLDAPVELLVGGTPCQSFSVAGLRGGLADPRGNLALRFVQLAAVMQPQWIVWENVPGVLSSGKGRDFGTFLGALGELGYGFAYRVLDAQWFGVAQRRRRVFVVGYLGDWRRAAAVLFERESVFGNPPTRGATGQGVAGCVTARFGRNGGSANDDIDGNRLIGFCNTAGDTALGLASDGGKTMPPITSRHGDPGCIAFDWQKGNDKHNLRPSTMNLAIEQSQTLGSTRVPAVAFSAKDGGADATHEVAPTMRAMGHSGSHANGGGQLAVAFTKSKRAQSTTDDETWVPGEVSRTMSCFDQGDTRATTVVTTPIDLRQASRGEKVTNNRASGSGGPPGHGVGDGGDPAFTVSERGQAVAIQDCSGREKQQNGKGWNDDGTAYTVDAAATQGVGIDFQNVANTGDVCGTIMGEAQKKGGEAGHGVMTAMAVRRLTPRECERLQGFPDDYTLVEYRKKPAADGPRYRALGNSMAVPVMRWIGERIQQVDRL